MSGGRKAIVILIAEDEEDRMPACDAPAGASAL
jgi:hypothetical protein